MNEKQLIRKKILEKKNKSFNDFANKQIIDKAIHIIDVYKPKVVGVYYPLAGEPNFLPLLETFQDSIIFALPKILAHNNMVFIEYQLTDELINNSFFKLLEPNNINKRPVIPDMIFVPGLAFNINGYRLGRGGGNYDRYLSKNNVVAIGSVFHDYLMLHIPVEPHDQKLDMIITEQIMFKYPPNKNEYLH